jgi:hypothetical protein
VSINTRVRATSKSFVGGAEIQQERHRTRCILEVTSQLDVPTSLTPAPSHLLCFHFVGCAKDVSDSINRPVVTLSFTRVGGTSEDSDGHDLAYPSGPHNFFQGAIKTHSSLEVVERVLLVGDTPRIGAKRQIGS